MALPRRLRLSKTKDIERTLRRSRRFEATFLSLRVHKKEEPPGRLAIVVSKKVSKKTIVRNRVRRRIAEWMRTNAALAVSPADCVITVKPGAGVATRQLLYQELRLLAQKGGLV